MEKTKTDLALDQALRDPELAMPRGCHYVTPTETGVERCIVGTILHNVGVSDEVLCGNGLNGVTLEGRPDLREAAEAAGLDVDILIDLQSDWDASSISRVIDDVIRSWREERGV